MINKKYILKISCIGLVVILALLLSFITSNYPSFVDYYADDTTDSEPTTLWSSNSYDDGTSVSIYASSAVTAMSDVMLTSATSTTTASVSYTLTATITPSTAVNQLVDWSISWSNSTAVTNYVTVTPSSDGSKTATVTCYQAFDDDIFITVTTRDGGYQAICVVQYEGAPTSMSLGTSSLSTTTINSTQTVYSLSKSTTYYIDIDLDNTLGSVGDDYYSFTATLSGAGTMKCYSYTTGISGSSWGTSASYVTVSSVASTFATASISNNQLVIVVGSKALTDYYSSTYSSGYNITYYNKYNTWYYSAEGYLTVTVTCTQASFSETIQFKIV